MIRYSLVMPVYNAGHLLTRVVAPLQQLGPEWEVIVVDDGSSDDSVCWIRENAPWCRLLHQPNSGQAVARNLGVSVAQGDTLFFVDSDVAVDPQMLLGMASWMDEHPDFDGVFGCYSSWGYQGESALSRFRNLLHRLVHREQRGVVASFWTGLGAMRKGSFLRAGGFDRRLTGIEDVGLGKRLTDLGGRIFLNPDFEGRHLKSWTWRSMVMTDIFVRAKPWTYYGFLGLTPKAGLNLKPQYSLPPMFLLAALVALLLLPQLAPGLLSLYLFLNGPRYLYFASCAGVLLGLRSVGYLLVHHLCCLVGAGLGTIQAMNHHLVEKSRQVHHLPGGQQQDYRRPLLDGNGSQVVSERKLRGGS